MGLLSLFSSRKGDDPAPARSRRRSSADTGAGIAAGRGGRGGRGAADDFADDTLDPEFPQKQRARRRLIGAVVMTVAAVIVLPIAFENEPRPASDNIAVKLTSGEAETPRPEPRKAEPLPPQSSSQSSSRLDAQALDAGEELVNDTAPARAEASKEASKESSREAPRDAAKESRQDARADKDKDRAKADGSGKFVILVGAFSTEDKARTWMGKLKASKVPAYIERKTLSDGERILLRAGPFGDRAAADAAEKRVRAVGLTARIVEL